MLLKTLFYTFFSMIGFYVLVTIASTFFGDASVSVVIGISVITGTALIISEIREAKEAILKSHLHKEYHYYVGHRSIKK